MLYGFYFVPCQMDKLTNKMVQLIVNEYHEELPFADDFSQELRRWKVQSRDPEIKKKSRVSHALMHTSYYPNIQVILQLLLCFPVGSCLCECSFSALHQLKTWSRSSVSES